MSITAPVTMSAMEKMTAAQETLESENPLLPHQKEVLEKLKKLHVDHLQLEAEYRKEWNELKLKYFQKMNPLYEARANALTTKTLSNGTPASTSAENEAAATVIPDFWLTALKHNTTLVDIIEQHDEPILRYLRNITSEWSDEKEPLSFKIIMEFDENPFFTNKVLTKYFELEDEPDSEESVLTRTVGTEIDWKPGKNVMIRTASKRQRNKKTGEIRLVKVEKERESFFHFFSSHAVPESEALDSMKDHDVQELENTLELEYEMGCILRNRIIPHAVGWYLNIEIDSDDDDVDDDLDGDDDGDDEDDNDSEDEDNSEEEEFEYDGDSYANNNTKKTDKK